MNIEDVQIGSKYELTPAKRSRGSQINFVKSSVVTILKEYDRFFLVTTDSYKRCLNKADLFTGDIELVEVQERETNDSNIRKESLSTM